VVRLSAPFNGEENKQTIRNLVHDIKKNSFLRKKEEDGSILGHEKLFRVIPGFFFDPGPL